MAKADENDSTEPTSPTSSTPDDGGERPDGREEEWAEGRGDEPELTSEQAEYASADPDRDDTDRDDEVAAEGTEGDQARTGTDDDLVPVGAGRSGDSGRAGLRRRAAKQDEPSPKQRRSAEGPRRTTPPEFIRQSVAELRKVVYPTGQQLLNYFVVVLIFVLFIIAVVSLLDLAFGWVILRVFS